MKINKLPFQSSIYYKTKDVNITTRSQFESFNFRHNEAHRVPRSPLCLYKSDMFISDKLELNESDHLAKS